MSNLTLHASNRMRQRCIPKAVIDWLLVYGDEHKDEKGCTRIYFGRFAKASLKEQEDCLPFKMTSKTLRVYAVFSPDGVMITTGYLNRKYFTCSEWGAVSIRMGKDHASNKILHEPFCNVDISKEGRYV